MLNIYLKQMWTVYHVGKLFDMTNQYSYFFLLKIKPRSFKDMFQKGFWSKKNFFIKTENKIP